MSPINVNLTAAVTSPMPTQNVQGSVFQDVLNVSVTVAETQSAIPPADAASKVMPAVVNIPIAPAGAWEPQQATAAVAPSTREPIVSGVPTSNLREALEAAPGPAPSVQALVQNAIVQTGAATQPDEDLNTDAPECDAGDKTDAAMLPAQPALPLPVVQHIPTPRAAVGQVTSGTAAIDARVTGRKEAVTPATARIASKETLPDILEPVPALQADSASGGPNIMEPRFGMASAISAPVAQQVAAGQPLAELRQLILTQDGEWIGALARDIASNASRDNQLQFTLKPENLGLLDVAITSDNGQVDIRLETSSAAAAQIISADQARLIEDLRGAGLKLGQFEMANRQNGNDQQRRPTPDHQSSEHTSPTAQPKASSRASGRFA